LLAGNPKIFAIESSITQAYERLSFRGIGFFVIFINGRCYGNRSPDATMLACSFGEVCKRLAERGQHYAPFAAESDAGSIAKAYRSALYSDQQAEFYFNLPLAEFSKIIYSNDIAWAPDGDEAFDDGSHVMQFDVGDRVRLVAFKNDPTQLYDPQTLNDAWLAADEYYGILQKWQDLFNSEWTAASKVSEAEDQGTI
jgi:hypothetical protein